MSTQVKPVPTALTRAVRRGAPNAVKQVAAHWHGGSDHNITGVSHDTEWKTDGLVAELEELIRCFDPRHHDEPGQTLDELLAFQEWAKGTYNISSVSSAFDHRFMGDDGDEACLTCGARYELVHTSVEYPSTGRYRTSNGDDPMRCTGDTDMVHGDLHESGHEADCENGCSHCQHNCNCLVCRG